MFTHNLINAEKLNDHPNFSEGEYIQLDVHNTGKGYPLELSMRIFEFFFAARNLGTTKELRIGLALLWRHLTALGGFIKAFSESKSGTTFRIYLPTAEGDDRCIDLL